MGERATKRKSKGHPGKGSCNTHFLSQPWVCSSLGDASQHWVPQGREWDLVSLYPYPALLGGSLCTLQSSNDSNGFTDPQETVQEGSC